MKSTTSNLLDFCGIGLTLHYGDVPSIYPCVTIAQAAMSREGTICSYGSTSKRLTIPDLDLLAEQFQLASIQIRDYVASCDEGRRFERDQAIAFGADRLEGDLPNGPENTD